MLWENCFKKISVHLEGCFVLINLFLTVHSQEMYPTCFLVMNLSVESILF